MKLSIIFATIVCAVVGQELWETNPIVVTDPDLLRDLRGLRQNVRDRGCEINLCFAIDGSDSVTQDQFQTEKDFADLIINIITTDNPGNLAAVQYGTFNRGISPLNRRKLQVVKKIQRSRQVGGLSNIAGGLGYCGFQLRPRREDANKIILIGDGFDSIGFGPRQVAQVILGEGIDICAVAVGPSDVDALNLITGDPGRVVRIANFFDVGEIIVDVINDACGFN